VASIESAGSPASRGPLCAPAFRTALALAVLGGGLPGAGVAPLAGQAVEEGEGLVVRQLRFSGNHAFEPDLLGTAIATSNSSWFARFALVRWLGLGEKRRLNDREFRRDVARLRLFYQIHGFLDARVDTTVIRTERDVYITFQVQEGPPVLVRSLEVKGLDSLAGRSRLVRDLPLRVGRPFDRILLLATADTLVSRLQDYGYPEASALPFREVDREARTADISLVVDPGMPAAIAEIHVEGTSAVDSVFVRSLLATASGRRFSARDLSESQRNLYRSELFRYAAVTLDTAHYRPKSGFVPLTIQVTEGPLHRARASLGYGTYDCFRMGAGWAARNALGHGQIFDASGQISKLGVGTPFGPGLEKTALCSALADDSVGSAQVNYNVTGSFRRPAFISPANVLTFALFSERRGEYAVYLRDDVGGSITLTRETASRIPVSLTYRLSYGGTKAKAVSFCAFFNACIETDVRQLGERRMIATLALGVQRTRVNNPLDPERGSALSFETTHSSKVIGSSEFAQFTRLVGDAAWYLPAGGAVIGLHARGGLVISPRLSLGSGAVNFVPPEQRFYAGGPNDVRGYNRNQLGPLVYVVQDSALRGDTIPEDLVRVAATGGNTLVVANAEIRVPAPVLTDRLRLAAFVDAGSVWERGTEGAGPSLRITPGVGVRFLTLLGPARLDVAYNPSRLPGGRLYKVSTGGDLVPLLDFYRRPTKTGRGLVFQLSVGQAF
jgi:outer membrane protein assembly complex protein YaeT